MFLVPVSRRGSELSRLFDETFDRFFSQAGGPVFGPSAPGTTASPALDVTESERAWTVQMDLPGVAKEDVKVAIDGNQVSVQAPLRQDGERAEGDRIVYRERSAAAFARRFTLPAEIDQSQSSARLENGVLTLTLGKRSVQASAHLTVN